MNYKTQCEQLWKDFILAVELEADRTQSGKFTAVLRLREWDFKFINEVLADEMAAEKSHRRFAADGFRSPISNRTGALVILLSKIAEGAKLSSAPGFELFFEIRRSAAYALCIGYMLRAQLSPAWIEQAAALDYSAIMEGGQRG